MSELVPAGEGRTLAQLDEAKKQIALAREMAMAKELKDWRDKAAAMAYYAKSQDGAHAALAEATEIKLRAEAALGALDRQARPDKVRSDNRTSVAPTDVIPELGVSSKTKANWRKLGKAYDEGKLDELIETAKAETDTISTEAVVNLVKKEELADQKSERLKAEKKAAGDGTWAFLQGDSVAATQLLDDKSVNLVLTDPPYGAGYISNRRKVRHEAIASDGTVDDAIALFNSVLLNLLPKLRDDAHVLVFCRWKEEHAFRLALEAANLDVRSSVVWAKNLHGNGDLRGAFAPKHERVLHAAMPGAVMARREVDVIEAAKVSTGRHPTEKPVDLLSTLIRATTAPGDLVVDPFAGVGSTLAAAIDTGRIGWGVELDEHYFVIGTERLESL